MKRAIERGNIDGAKIHAQDAIRKKNEGLNMLRLASRLDGVVCGVWRRACEDERRERGHVRHSQVLGEESEREQFRASVGDNGYV